MKKIKIVNSQYISILMFGQEYNVVFPQQELITPYNQLILNKILTNLVSVKPIQNFNNYIAVRVLL